jgi:hypothetical protein
MEEYFQIQFLVKLKLLISIFTVQKNQQALCTVKFAISNIQMDKPYNNSVCPA